MGIIGIMGINGVMGIMAARRRTRRTPNNDYIINYIINNTGQRSWKTKKRSEHSITSAGKKLVKEVL